jgi:chitodextrinase
VDLSWTKPARISPDGYNVYDGTSPDGVSGPVNDTGLITGTSFQVTSLDPGTTYYFQVTEVVSDPDGGQSESDRSTPAVQATTPTPGPAAPTGLTARVVSSSEVDLSWTAPPVAPPCDDASAGCYNYNVYEGTSSGGESRRDLVTGTTFQVKGLASGTTYYFEVTAVDPAGKESGPSNEAQATTLPSGGGSAAPTGLTARAVSSSEVDLSWTAPGGGAAAGYYVYDGSSSNGESGPVNADPVTGTTFRVTGLHGGTTYYFKVTAVDAGKESGFSNEAQATTPTLVPAPGPPWGVLVGLAVIVAAIVGVFVWRRLPRHWPPDPVIKAVPHAGPPLAKSIHATGRGPTHTVRIESHPGKSITTKEVRPR